MADSSTPVMVLDCDGVLADTERYGHLPAFNQTFAEFGLPVRWSVAEYREKVRIGGGKERMASLLTPEFVAAADLPADPEGQQAVIAAWHRRKTEIYTGLVASGAVPPRPGIARIVGEALAGGWPIAVASTSAETSVRATLERAVGAEQARAVKVFAGNIVPHKKPAPDIYLLALDSLGVPAGRVIVVEDSRNGLLAATRAGLTCVITVNDFTADEDFSEAALVVTSLGDPGGERTTVLANRSQARPGDWITLADLASVLPPPPAAARPPRGDASDQGAPMSEASLGDVEVVVRTIATVAVDNEKYFGELDAVVGDGDFGYSMARGFELVIQNWDDFDRTDIGTFLKKIAVAITSRIGGTSARSGEQRSCGRARPPGPPSSSSRPRSSPCCAPRSRESRRAGAPTSATRRCSTRSSPRSTPSRSTSGRGTTRPRRCGQQQSPHESKPRRRVPCRRCAAGPAIPASAASARWTRERLPSP